MNFKELAAKYVIQDDRSGEPPWSWEILTPSGSIYPFSENAVAVWTRSKHVARKLAGIGLTVLQSGEEFSFRFDARRLDEIAGIVKARRKRRLNLSQERRADLAARMVHIRKRLEGSNLNAPDTGLKAVFPAKG